MVRLRRLGTGLGILYSSLTDCDRLGGGALMSLMECDRWKDMVRGAEERERARAWM